MIKIIDGRGTGKTSRLILLAKEMGATIVCSNPIYIKIIAEKYGITGLDVITYNQYLSSQYDYSNRKILIDEVEGLLAKLHGNCIGYSISVENKNV